MLTKPPVPYDLCFSVPISHLRGLMPIQHCVLKGQQYVVSNRRRPQQGLLCDYENRWIVCSSSHQSSNGDIRASASVPLSAIILRTEAGGSIRGIFLTDEKCLLPYSLKYIISSSLVSYKSHHIKYGSLCTVCNNMETSGSLQCWILLHYKSNMNRILCLHLIFLWDTFGCPHKLFCYQ